MFKFRTGSQGKPATAAPQSIEMVRQRARHRLIGAAVLVLLGVIGLPLLFDSQPRPIAVDIPIEIPAKNESLPPLVVGAAAPAVPAASRVAPVTPTQPPTPEPAGLAQGAQEALVPAAAPQAGAGPAARAPAPAAPAPARAVESTPTPARAPAPAPADGAKIAEAARIKALLEGRTAAPPTAPAPAAAQRVVVQVGAFADPARAREVRQQLERAGLKTYVHVAQTAQGERIRVRLGPFASRVEAEQAAARVRALGLPAAILTL